MNIHGFGNRLRERKSHEGGGVKNTVVLIVDDDPTTTVMLKHILQQVGFQTACATSGDEGITLARSLRPDLILLDVHLPDKNGFSVCRDIRSNPETADTPIIFISANEEVSSKVLGFEAGGVDYVTKPLAGIEVIARVKTHLRLKHAFDTLARLQAERIERIAATQHMILPSPASFPFARFAVSFKQIQGAGGDFYDVIPVGDFLVDYVIADASGHDLEASLWTTAMKTLLHEHARPLYDPSEILLAINNSLCSVMPEGLFFTVLYARLNRQTGRLTLVNGGHPPAICLKGNTATVVRQTGDVIGSFSDASFETTEMFLEKGDRFALYTDGLLGNGREREIIDLAETCRAFRELPLEAMVEKTAAAMQMRTDIQDDVVLMGVEV